MILPQFTAPISFDLGNTIFSFLDTGDIFDFSFKGIMINQFRGSPKEGSANNIYLRVYDECGVSGSSGSSEISRIRSYPLLGISSVSSVEKGENLLVFSGIVEDIEYNVTFYAADSFWLWDVKLAGDDKTVDIIYGQDIGIANKAAVLNNELYTSQYLDHNIFETENGYKVCTRQNLPQDKMFPYLQQGMLKGKATGFSTDGMQFFGLSYKHTHIPEALNSGLQNANYQFECAYTALQSDKIRLNGRLTENLVFYGYFCENHPEAVKNVEFSDDIGSKYDKYQEVRGNLTEGSPNSFIPCNAAVDRAFLSDEFGEHYSSPGWWNEKINSVFPEKKLEEEANGELLSFFTPSHTHVVLQKKELMVERPHGHILMTGVENLLNDSAEIFDKEFMNSTNYIYGLFNGQVAVGNSGFHKLLSTPRGSLNILKNSGQRIYIKLGGKYRMLTIPAVYEMGLSFSRWYYEIDADTLIITAYCSASDPSLVLNVSSLCGVSYDFIITNQIVMGEREFAHSPEVSKIGETLRFTMGTVQREHSPYPDLFYDLSLPGTDYTFSDDRVFFSDDLPRDNTLLTICIDNSTGFKMIVTGGFKNIPEQPLINVSGTVDYEYKKYIDCYNKLMSGFKLEVCDDGDLIRNHNRDVERINEVIWWYTHNALIHFLSPQGLEQSGGAAWGTRDICQGPFELLMLTRQYKIARATILRVFSYLSEKEGQWPQWFMFDRYPYKAGDCHGDIIFWPLKCVAEYILYVGDHSILDEIIPYAEGSSGSVSEHIKIAVDSIESGFLPGTSLISYAGGDWDDTLQPANRNMQDNLVSSWTMALASQTLRSLAEAFFETDEKYAAHLKHTAAAICTDYNDICIKDGVSAGFVYRNPDSSFKYLLHPLDETTGINYRLLPMTRSIIAEIVSEEQAAKNLALIDEFLMFPDGVRIMDKPARYEGGVSRDFCRAEQAANVGREISLQYIHAHIRYIEAMAKLGESKRAWEGLLKINPVLLTCSVPNAEKRQSNVYFSSSDGLFMDRYDYSRNFSKLRDGSIPVRGGWRLYSSGPGIYLNQLISNVLGIRFAKDTIIIDPVLPAFLDGLTLDYTCFGKPTRFVYEYRKNRDDCIKVVKGDTPLEGFLLKNRYRKSGISIKKDDFLATDGDVIVSY